MNLQHEFKHMPPVVSKLMWAYHRVLAVHGWELDPVRTGYNSFKLWNIAAEEYHFRWRRNTPDTIWVFDRYQQPRNCVAELKSDIDVMRFVIAVRDGKKLKYP